MVDKDQVRGRGKQLKGKTRRKVAEWSGDTGQQVEGAAEELAGTVQKKYGDAKQEIKRQGRKRAA
jgi:uncharacterized protein YjbJ (UPF0337 family)